MAFLTTETSFIMEGDASFWGEDLSMADLVQADIEMDLDSQEKEDLLYADESDSEFDNPFADMDSDTSDASDVQSLEEDFALAAGSLGGHLDPLVMEEEEPQRLRRAEAGRYGFDIVVIGGRAYPADTWQQMEPATWQQADATTWQQQALQQGGVFRGAALEGYVEEDPVEGVVCETPVQGAQLYVDQHGQYMDYTDRIDPQDDDRQTSTAAASSAAAAGAASSSPPRPPQPGVSPPQLSLSSSSLTSLRTSSSSLSTHFGVLRPLQASSSLWTAYTLHHAAATSGLDPVLMRATGGEENGNVVNGGRTNTASTQQHAVQDLVAAMAGAYESAVHTGGEAVDLRWNNISLGHPTIRSAQQGALRNLVAATAGAYESAAHAGASVYIGGRGQDGVLHPATAAFGSVETIGAAVNIGSRGAQHHLANAAFESVEPTEATVIIGGRGQDGVRYPLANAAFGSAELIGANVNTGVRSQNGAHRYLANAAFGSAEPIEATISIGGRGQDGVRQLLEVAASNVQTFRSFAETTTSQRSRDMLRTKPKSLKRKPFGTKTCCQLALPSVLAAQPAIMVC